MLQTIHQIALLIALALGLPSEIWGKTPCLLVVDITSPEDLSSQMLFQIELVANNGRLIKSIASAGSHFEICDYPFGEHTLKIKSGECFETSLFGIGRYYPREERLIVPMIRCRGGGQMGGGGGTGCPVHIRVSGGDMPIGGASVSGLKRYRSLTDEYGRATILLDIAAASEEIVISAKGYLPVRRTMRCGLPVDFVRGMQLEIRLAQE